MLFKEASLQQQHVRKAAWNVGFVVVKTEHVSQVMLRALRERSDHLACVQEKSIVEKSLTWICAREQLAQARGFMDALRHVCKNNLLSSN